MHCFFVNGIFNGTAGQPIVASKRANIEMYGVGRYLKLHQFLRALSDRFSVAAVFASDRVKNPLAAQTFKCSAGDGLNVYPVLSQFCVSYLGHPKMQAHCEVFLNLAHTIRIWQQSGLGLSTAMV